MGQHWKMAHLLDRLGDGKVAPATRADYAEALAVVLADDDAHSGKTYELAGDEAFTMAEFAAEISAQSGKEIPYNSLPKEAYAEILNGFMPGAGEMLADADYQASQGALFDDSKTLSKLIGRPTTPMKEAVAAALT